MPFHRPLVRLLWFSHNCIAEGLIGPSRQIRVRPSTGQEANSRQPNGYPDGAKDFD
jgi:hypothetical protein